MAKSAPEPKSEATAGAPTAPGLVVNAQYVKDLSFENPRAPASLSDGQRQNPKVDVSIDVNARRIKDTMFEVVLHIRANASHDDGALFLAEVDYAGVFTVSNVPEDSIEPMLLIHAPQLLFPFARAIIADSVRDGGFSPLLVHPIDFAALYRQRKQKKSANGQGSGEQTNGAAKSSDDAN